MIKIDIEYQLLFCCMNSQCGIQTISRDLRIHNWLRQLRLCYSQNKKIVFHESVETISSIKSFQIKYFRIKTVDFTIENEYCLLEMLTIVIQNLKCHNCISFGVEHLNTRWHLISSENLWRFHICRTSPWTLIADDCRWMDVIGPNWLNPQSNALFRHLWDRIKHVRKSQHINEWIISENFITHMKIESI